MRKSFLIIALLLLPSMLFSVYPEVARGAGFAKQSIFLSSDSPTEGDSVFIYVVLANDTEQPFAGLLKIYDEMGNIGTSSVALAPGKAETASISWQPTAGVHALNAVLETSDGKTPIESENATFPVAPKPVPAATPAVSGQSDSVAVGSSLPIQQSLANLSPSVARDVQPIFSAIDSGRTAATGALNTAVSWSKGQSAKLPAPTAIPTSAGGAAQSAESMLVNALMWLLLALRFCIANVGVFYPAFVLIFFFVIWKLWRRMRRPRYY